MTYDFNNKIALVTGASSGLGKLISIELASLGAHVVGVARREERLRELEVQIGNGKFSYIVADLLNPEDRKRIIEDIYTKFNGAEILVNNAGMVKPVLAFDNFKENREKFLKLQRDVLELDLIAPFDLYDAWLFEFEKRKSKGSKVRNPNVCIYISSQSGFYAWEGAREYQMAKTALIAGVCESRVELEELKKTNSNLEDLQLRSVVIYPDTFESEIPIPDGWDRMPAKFIVDTTLKSIKKEGNYGKIDDIIVKMNPDGFKGIYVGFIPTDKETKRPNFDLTMWEKIGNEDQIKNN